MATDASSSRSTHASTLLLKLVVVVSAMTMLTGAAAGAAQPSVPFGVNGDWDYVDLVKSIGGWSPITGDAPVPLDQNGWPMSDAKFVLFDLRHNMPWNGPDPDAVQQDVSGVYNISFAGQATIDTEYSATVRNQVYNAGTNTTTAELVVPPFQWLVFVDLKDTKRKASDAAGTGFTNLRIVRPGYPVNSTRIFTTGTLKALAAPFSVIRFLGQDAANDYQTWTDDSKTQLNVTRWADRVKVTDAYQGGLPQNNTGGKQSHGQAWEYMIQLCNQTQHDMWLNVPASADDDYVTQLATLLKFGNQYSQGLQPNLRIYVEYSNEVWNHGFPQGEYNQAKAEAAGLTEPQQYVKRSIEIARIFENVFGPGTFKHRIRPVVVWQYTTEMDIFEALQWWERQSGERVSSYLYGIGQAGYYDPTDTSTVDNIFSTLWLGSDSVRRNFIGWQAVATYFGLQQVDYEAGPSLNGGRWGGWPFDTFAHTGGSATRDARMVASEVHHFIDNWFAIGGDTICFFALRGSVSPWGNWLLVENFENLNTPKMQGALDILSSAPPKLTAGHVLPWRIGQAVTIDGSQRTPDPWMPDLAPGSPLPLAYASEYAFKLENLYLLRAVAEGKYAISLYGRAASGAQVHVFVDDQDLGEVALPSDSDGDSGSVTVTLRPGLHSLLLRNVGSADAVLAGNGANIRVRMTAGNGKGDVPSAPMNVSAQPGDGKVALSWASAASATGYRVKRSSAYAGPYETIGSPAANSFVDTTAANGGTYFYAVAAVNEVGEGALSPVQMTTPAAAAPAAPVIEHMQTTTTAAGFFDGGQVWFDWQPVEGAAYYQVQRRGAPWWGKDFNPEWWWYETVMTQKDTTFGESNLFPGMPYKYKVVAVNWAGETESAETEVTIPADQQVPAAPAGLAAEAVNGTVSLRWIPNLFLTPAWWPPQYNIKRSTQQGGPYTTIASNSTDNLLDTTVERGTTYYYVVSASDGAGESGNSEEVSVTP